MPQLRESAVAAWIHLFPRRKADGGDAPPCKRRTPVLFDRTDLEALFELPQPDAARRLGISLTTLKQACRKLGVKRWPYQRPTVWTCRTTELLSGDPSEHASLSGASSCPTPLASSPRSPTSDDDSDASSICASEDPRLYAPATADVVQAGAKASIARPEELVRTRELWPCLSIWLTEPTGDQIVYDDEEFDRVIASLP